MKKRISVQLYNVKQHAGRSPYRLTRFMAFCLAGLIALTMSGCAFWDAAMLELDAMLAQEQEVSSSSEVSSSTGGKVVRSGASLRGSDRKGLDAVGELVEDPDTSSSSEIDQQETAFVWPLEMMPYRAMLSEKEQSVYDEIYRNISTRNHTFQLSGRISVDRINDVVNSVYYDNPDFFWLDSSYRYTYNTQNEVMGLQISFNATAGNYELNKKRFDAAAQVLIDEARKLPSEVEQEKYVHDRLLDLVEYDLDAPNNQSAYSALVGKKSVCAGYARAFQYVMMKLGVPCYYCVGVAREDHAWNIIKLDGNFYNIDVSWDDPVGNPDNNYNYDYFNLTDEQMVYDHQRRELSVNLPACTSQEMGYAETFGDAGGQVRKGGELQSYEDVGFSNADVLHTLDEYYQASYQLLAQNGEGENQMEFVLADEALLIQVRDAVQSQEWFNQYVIPAAQELELNGFSAEIDLQTQELADGFYRLIQTITLAS